jgi:hypothetical protein
MWLARIKHETHSSKIAAKSGETTKRNLSLYIFMSHFSPLYNIEYVRNKTAAKLEHLATFQNEIE